MIKRSYFMSARCTDGAGYCYQSKTGTYSSFTSQGEYVYTLFSEEIKKELLAIRPDGQFEVVSFSRI